MCVFGIIGAGIMWSVSVDLVGGKGCVCVD